MRRTKGRMRIREKNRVRRQTKRRAERETRGEVEKGTRDGEGGMMRGRLQRKRSRAAGR